MSRQLENGHDPLPYKLAGTLFAGIRYHCSGCGGEIIGFRDRLSAKEFRISGLCQVCQDGVFGVKDEDD